MMNLVEKLYKATLDNVLYDVSDNNKELISKLYFEYLNRNYSNMELSEQALKYYSFLEKNNFENIDERNKIGLLSLDTDFNEIIELSMLAYNYCLNYINDGKLLDINVAEDLIFRLNSKLENVNDYNKEMAEYYCSEGIADLYYASEMSEYTSLRMGTLVSKKK